MGKAGFDFESLKRIEQDEKERARLMSIGGQVKSAVLLSELEAVPISGGVYDTLEITEYRGTSARLKLPAIITEKLEKDKGISIRISRDGDIIVLMPADDGYNVSVDKALKPSAVFSPRLAFMLRDRGIKLPVKYTVSTDEPIRRDKDSAGNVAGWVCRKKV